MALLAEEATELDIALPMRRGALAPRTIGPAPETDTALPLTVVRAGSLESRGTFVLSLLATRSYFIGDAVPLETSAPPGAAVTYEWEVEHQQTHIVQKYTTVVPNVTWTPTRAGHFIARVRSCTVAACTPWLSTADRGYMLFAWLRPPQF